ncbi:MAG: helix-turn-helix domain-containing protein [Eubacteriales bacterium]
MTLSQFAECLSISTKLASRLVHEGKVFAKKVGREYRISKSSVVEFVRGEKKHKKESCVVNVTSNPQDWIIEDKCGILCAAAKRKEVC